VCLLFILGGKNALCVADTRKAFSRFHGNNGYLNGRQCFITRSLAVFLLHPNNDTVGSPTAGSGIEEYYELQTQDTIRTSVPFETIKPMFM